MYLGKIYRKIKRHKYITITIAFISMLIPLLYLGLETENPVIGSFLIAVASVYAMVVTNLSNNDTIMLQLKQNHNMISLDLRKKDMQISIEKLRKFLKESTNRSNHLKDIYKLRIFYLYKIKNNDCFMFLPTKIQDRVEDLIKEFINHDIESDFRNTIMIIQIRDKDSYKITDLINITEKEKHHSKYYEILYGFLKKTNNNCNKIESKKEDKIEKEFKKLLDELNPKKIENLIRKEFEF